MALYYRGYYSMQFRLAGSVFGRGTVYPSHIRVIRHTLSSLQTRSCVPSANKRHQAVLQRNSTHFILNPRFEIPNYDRRSMMIVSLPNHGPICFYLTILSITTNWITLQDDRFYDLDLRLRLREMRAYNKFSPVARQHTVTNFTDTETS